MPELPDIVVYLDCLQPRVVGHVLKKVRVKSPFLVRTFDPPISEVEGKRVLGLQRMGKRIIFEFEHELYLVLHLMIAGRLKWRPAGVNLKGKIDLAAFEFESGTLLLTEASTKKRASVHMIRGTALLAAHHRGGLEVLDADLPAFASALRREVHTLKRTLTDPRLFSGIGNAYSDEILHRAGLSPMQRTNNLSDKEIERLYDATQSTLREWTARLRAEVGEGFPEKVTAFRPEMAVHGRFKQPCPVCGAPVQRIVYAENECNYCPRCQTGGKVLADRSMSRLLHEDWPRTIDEWEEHFAPKNE
jgi:formamidopyrimidine-DNA glycosylase